MEPEIQRELLKTLKGIREDAEKLKKYAVNRTDGKNESNATMFRMADLLLTRTNELIKKMTGEEIESIEHSQESTPEADRPRRT